MRGDTISRFFQKPFERVVVLRDADFNIALGPVAPDEECEMAETHWQGLAAHGIHERCYYGGMAPCTPESDVKIIRRACHLVLGHRSI
jgi:hypothetical protein